NYFCIKVSVRIDANEILTIKQRQFFAHHNSSLLRAPRVRVTVPGQGHRGILSPVRRAPSPAASLAPSP
ncbi:MAG TPA: hypothetical protein VK629_10620, partial [Steroidobacteraceae bacterium]|nr:hypothetical protein [Steroidobacteraceae bacterium]